MTGGRRALRGVGQDLNLDPYAGMPCKSVPLTAPVTGTTGSGQLCYYGTCGDVNALRQALQDLGFGPVTSSTNLGAAGGPLAKAAAKYGVSYAPGASPSADLCVAILNAWHPPITGVRSTMMSRTMMSASTTGVKAPPSTKATCVGECLYWDGVEQKCFTITTGKCAPAQQQQPPLTFIPRGGTPTTGVTPVPLLQLPPDVMCNAKGGTWDAATGLCSAGALQPTPEQTKLACDVSGGFYDPATGQCYAIEQPPTREQGWWSGLSDGTKYAIIGGAVVGVGAIGAGVYFMTRKPRAKANKHRSYALRGRHGALRSR